MSALETEDRGSVVLIVGWTECAITSLFVIGRIYNRLNKRGSLGADDWLIILAFLLALIFMCITTPEVNYGTGRHVQFLTHEQRINSAKLDWISQAFHIMSTGVAKISIVIFIRQILGKERSSMWFLYIMVFLLFVAKILAVAFIFGQCSPTAALWDPSLADTASCWDPKIQQRFCYFTACFSIFSDFVLAIFPATIIRKLQVEWRLKLSLMFYMGLGIFASIASIIKTIHINSLSSRNDYTYETVDFIIWMMTGQFCIIIAACIPPMRSLFVDMFRKIKSLPSTQRFSNNPAARVPSKQGYFNHVSHDEGNDTGSIARKYWTTSTAVSAKENSETKHEQGSDRGIEVEMGVRRPSDEYCGDLSMVIVKQTEFSILESSR